METLILVIHIVVAVFLIGTILLQSGKGADIGAAFGAGTSQGLFGPRGATTLLHKVTIAAAAIFLLTSMVMTYTAKRTESSVLESISHEGLENELLPQNAESQKAVSGDSAEPAENLLPDEKPTPNQGEIEDAPLMDE